MIVEKDKLEFYNIDLSAEQMAKILPSANMGIWSMIRQEGKRPSIWLDETAQALVGCDPNLSPEDAFEFLNAHIEPSYFPATIEYTEQLLAGEPAEVVYAYRHPERGIITIRCGGCLDSSYTGDGVRVWGYHQDISEQTKKLDESQRINVALGGLFFAVYKINIPNDTLIRIKNGPVYEEKTAHVYKASEVTKIILETINDEVHKEKYKEFTDLSTMHQRLRGKRRITLEHLSNVYGWCRSTIIPMGYDNTGDLVEVLYLVAEISDEKEKEHEYKQSLIEAKQEAQRANKAKTDFLSNMSHDIRTPMNAIIGLTQIAQKSLDNIDEVKQCLDDIALSSKHLMSLINDVLDMSKLESGNMSFIEEPFDLRKILDETYAIVKPQADMYSVDIVYDGGIPEGTYVIGCPLHLRQVFINLCVNGIKYNKPGGKLYIEVEENKIDEDTVEYSFIHRDTGIGMSEKFLEKVFEPFSQEDHSASRTEYKGTGLGLSIVKLLVENMGGTIKAESVKGEGSTFTVKIRFKIDKEVYVADDDVASEEVSLEGIKVLLVEDNKINQTIAKRMLNDFGAVVTTANNGELGVQQFIENEPGTFDVILMDIMMPVMDGISATMAIRCLDRDDAKKIPIIAMTANAFAEDGKKCIEAGMDQHIAKPFEMDKVAAILKSWVGKTHSEN